MGSPLQYLTTLSEKKYFLTAKPEPALMQLKAITSHHIAVIKKKKPLDWFASVNLLQVVLCPAPL